MSSKRAVKRTAQRKQCGTKKRYDSEGVAVSHAIAATKAWQTTLRAYQCRWCGMWHIGNRRRAGRALSRLDLLSKPVEC